MENLVMPDFAKATHAFHHTLDSALSILSCLNISPSRVSITMDGRGYPTRWIVSQSPEAGASLAGGTLVSLRVAGTGMFHALPVGMWDRGNEEEPGTFELIGILDDPYQKAAHWVREGARLFDVQPEDYAACARWIALFGLEPDEWPRELWYKLAILLPSLHSLAGREHGFRFILHLLLGLSLHQIRRSRAVSYLDDTSLTKLGGAFSRLGVDSAVGNRAEDLARITLVLGPVPLTVYYSFQTGAKAELLQKVSQLSMSLYQQFTIDWLVLDPNRPPRLGIEAENSRLGINSHLGAAIPPPEAPQRNLHAQ